MYRLTIEDAFSAAHAIVIAGERERLHGHDWHVRVTLEGETLDADGLLVDFHWVQHELREILAPFRNANLNETPPFNKLNPTAEHVAEHIATGLTRRLASPVREAPKNGGPAHPPLVTGAPSRRVRVRSVRVTEAVGCAAEFEPPETIGG